jgi:hypothetical protein
MKKQSSYNPNEEETEEDGIRAGELRLLKVRHQFQALTGRTHNLLPLPKPKQKQTE